MLKEAKAALTLATDAEKKATGLREKAEETITRLKVAKMGAEVAVTGDETLTPFQQRLRLDSLNNIYLDLFPNNLKIKNKGGPSKKLKANKKKQKNNCKK